MDKNNIGRPRGLPKTGGRPVTRQDFVCPACGDKFSRTASDLRSYESRRPGDTPCCSVKCALVWRYRDNRITLPCGYCGKLISVTKSGVGDSSQIFCNRAAYTSYLSGKHNPRACTTLTRGKQYACEPPE
jgi:hypothetical protein